MVDKHLLTQAIRNGDTKALWPMLDDMARIVTAAHRRHRTRAGVSDWEDLKQELIIYAMPKALACERPETAFPYVLQVMTRRYRKLTRRADAKSAHAQAFIADRAHADARHTTGDNPEAIPTFGEITLPEQAPEETTEAYVDRLRKQAAKLPDWPTPSSRRVLTTEDRFVIVAMRQRGFSVRAISRAVGCSHVSVLRVCRFRAGTLCTT
jgi:DNA-directed RNA polymerase specialized sigma24 family protein